MSTANTTKNNQKTMQPQQNRRTATSFLPKLSSFHAGLLYTVFSAIIIIAGTVLAITYARGNYRLTRQGFLREAGLLNTNSFPTGAEVFIDGRLVTATDDTMYLEPGEYEVEIVKDGYWPWRKTLQVERELVTQTNALLLPSIPSLTPLTFSGVDRVFPSPDGQKLLYITSTATNATRNGLYVLELTDSMLSLQRGPRQLAELPTSFDLETADFIWSPDSNEVMILAPNRELLITIDRKHAIDTLADISLRRRQILSEWEEEMYLRERQFLAQFPDEIIEIATTSAQNVYISPDKKRLFYTATQAITLPTNLIPPIPATSTQPETRELQPGSIYVYDREEDKNFFIAQERLDLMQPKQLLATDLYNRAPQTLQASPSAFLRLQTIETGEDASISNIEEINGPISDLDNTQANQVNQNATAQVVELSPTDPDASDSASMILSSTNKIAQNFNRYHTALHLNTFQWFPDSRHLLYMYEQAIEIRGYDNTNRTIVYSGPFDKNFVYPWPDGRKVLILTAFNPEQPMNLYAIELK